MTHESKQPAGEPERFARVLERATEALGSSEKARRWIEQENRALSGRRPVDLLDTEDGARRVETILGRVEHGIYS